MNLGVEFYLFVGEEDWGPEHIAGVSLQLSEKLLELGYGNVAADDPKDTRLKSVVIVRPLDPKERPEDNWEAHTKGAMAISFPTEDEEFIRQADDGDIEAVG